MVTIFVALVAVGAWFARGTQRDCVAGYPMVNAVHCS